VLAQQAPAEPPEEAAPAAEEAEEVHSEVASFAVTRLQESPAVVTAMTADEIRSSGARDLMDVLLQIPGFFFGVTCRARWAPASGACGATRARCCCSSTARR
jgi:outer membrane receptor for ferrienterochelin and colicin